MKDIKSLYLTAKSSGSQRDIDTYMEHVRDLLENRPNGYMSDVEYIISSNIGLTTLKEFIERHGLSLAAYDPIMEQLEVGLKKSKLHGHKTAPYEEAIAMLEAFADKYRRCFIMYETFHEKMPQGYLEVYYRKPNLFMKSGQKILDFTGNLSRFGEAAIPDMLIFAESIGTFDQVTEWLATPSAFSSPTYYQWILESMKDFSAENQSIYEQSLQGVYDRLEEKKFMVLRESVLTHNDDLTMEYTSDEVHALEDIISFKEYYLTCLESTDGILALQNEIYTHYEAIAELVEEDSSAVMSDMLAPSKPGISSLGKKAQPGYEDAVTGTNTLNKYTGQAADYIKKNHAGASWGEDDGASNSPKKEPTLDDFKRPSIDSSKGNLDDTIDASELKQNISDAKTPAEKQQAINNYYLYSYHNSFNKQSTDSHNLNVQNTDDSSVNKRVNSADGNHHPLVKESSTYGEYEIKKGNADGGGFAGYQAYKNGKLVTSGDTIEEVKKDLDDSQEKKIKESVSWELDFPDIISFPTEGIESPDTLRRNRGDYLLMELKATGGDNPTAGSADNDRPTSDNPIKDTFMDIDRELTKAQQGAKKVVQGGVQTGRAILKPGKRTAQWVSNMVTQWKDADENKIKERMADPHARSNLWKAIKIAIMGGSLFKAGLLLNPFFLFLGITKGIGKNKREFRLRNEMLKELETELQVIDMKIQHAASKGDIKTQAQLMRFKSEIDKKRIRIGTGPARSARRAAKMI